MRVFIVAKLTMHRKVYLKKKNIFKADYGFIQYQTV